MKKKSTAILSVILLVVVAYSCKKNTSSESLSGASLQLPATTDVYYTSGGVQSPSVDTMNKMATLGRVLFYDSHLSINNAVACGSCHKQSLGFSDNIAFSKGFEGKLTKRNSLPINDLQGKSLFWDGRENNVNNLSLRPLTNHVEMGIEDAGTLPQKLGSLAYYNNLFASAYGDNQVSMDRISTAIGAFISAIKTGNSRLDQFNLGNTSILTAQEMQGKMLFDTKYNCGSCHNGGGGMFFVNGGNYNGGGNSFLDIGLDNSYSDLGRGGVTTVSADKGTFRVPDLHNVAITAPYMHDGRYKTLSDVLDHYSHGIDNSPNLDTLLKDKTGVAIQMNISDPEKQAIIAFLNTLTDYQMISDPKFSNPFKAN